MRSAVLLLAVPVAGRWQSFGQGDCRDQRRNAYRNCNLQSTPLRNCQSECERTAYCASVTYYARSQGCRIEVPAGRNPPRCGGNMYTPNPGASYPVAQTDGSPGYECWAYYPDPTRSPRTSSPTRFPTTFPTNPPRTSAPSSAPSTEPSPNPTGPPTTVPTRSPSRSPLPEPTRSPSTTPSRHPSAVPTVPPTLSPLTSEPSRAPSAPPTTSQPSGSPSLSPSSSSPSTHPSAPPSAAPHTSAPTRTPSTPPSATPLTSAPSATPLSSAPTLAPSSSAPSLAPSAHPSSTPTTAGPSDAPLSSAPSSHPSTGAPTGQPQTSAPSAAPSATPSQTPTSGPLGPPPTGAPRVPPTAAPTAGIGNLLPDGPAGTTVDVASGVSAGVAAVVGAGATGPAVARLGVVLRLAQCSVDDVDLEEGEQLDREFHPTGLGIGNTTYKYMLGAIVMNPVIVVGTGVIVAFAARLQVVMCRLKWEHAQSTVRSPGIIAVPLVFLMQGTVLAAGRVALYPAPVGSGAHAGGIISLAVCIITPLVIWRTVLRDLRESTCKVADPRLSGTLGTALRPWQRKIYLVVFGKRVWVPISDGVSPGAYCCERYGPFYEQYKEPGARFMLVELANMLALGVVAAWRPAGRVECCSRNCAATAVLLAHCVALIALRPYEAPVDAFLALTVAFGTAAAVGGMTTDLCASTDHFGEFAAQSLLITANLVLAKAVADLLIWLADLRLARRSAPRSAAREHGIDPKKGTILITVTGLVEDDVGDSELPPLVAPLLSSSLPENPDKAPRAETPGESEGDEGAIETPRPQSRCSHVSSARSELLFPPAPLPVSSPPSSPSRAANQSLAQPAEPEPLPLTYLQPSSPTRAGIHAAHVGRWWQRRGPSSEPSGFRRPPSLLPPHRHGAPSTPRTGPPRAGDSPVTPGLPHSLLDPPAKKVVTVDIDAEDAAAATVAAPSPTHVANTSLLIGRGRPLTSTLTAATEGTPSSPLALLGPSFPSQGVDLPPVTPLTGRGRRMVSGLESLGLLGPEAAATAAAPLLMAGRGGPTGASSPSAPLLGSQGRVAPLKVSKDAAGAILL
eukprot:TRINITY_DN16952_c0_g1_i1.p1 TRINITY_DN16952_c0_g1~~TRINITY_DN16952_c0_g1_i1.p1  ORF type:complete len:1086 (+),score=131.11 TRINITY_DN16952_c0_g1_i1:40-3258(+)